MEKVSTIGLDVAKHVFQVHGVDAEGAVVVRRKLRRDGAWALAGSEHVIFDDDELVTNRVSDEPARYTSCDACHRCTNDQGAKTRTGAGPVRNKNRASRSPILNVLTCYRRRAGLVSAYSHNVLKPCSVRQSARRQYCAPDTVQPVSTTMLATNSGLILGRPPMKDEK